MSCPVVPPCRGHDDLSQSVTGGEGIHLIADLRSPCDGQFDLAVESADSCVGIAAPVDGLHASAPCVELRVERVGVGSYEGEQLRPSWDLARNPYPG